MAWKTGLQFNPGSLWVFDVCLDSCSPFSCPFGYSLSIWEDMQVFMTGISYNSQFRSWSKDHHWGDHGL